MSHRDAHLGVMSPLMASGGKACSQLQATTAPVVRAVPAMVDYFNSNTPDPQRRKALESSSSLNCCAV